MTAQRVETTCCIAGGGPAGMMLGYLLARAGVSVTVLEKHRDFFRDFRGDTVHPSTLELMYELGLLEELLKIPHQQLTSVGGRFGDFPFQAANFRHLPVHAKFVALMPQWDFLNFLSERAQRFADLSPSHGTRSSRPDSRCGQVAGVQARNPGGEVEIRSDLVIGCDGRHSTMRQAARLEVIEAGVPIDVLWFRISRQRQRPGATAGKHQLRPGADPDQPQQLLSGGTDHRQRLLRGDQATGPRSISRTDPAHRAFSGRPRRGDSRIGIRSSY